MSDSPVSIAPGWPGIPPRWTSSVKSGVGAALGAASEVWFTLSHGILDEIYYPRVDSACTRDFGLIVTDGESYFSEEKRDARSQVSRLAPGVPAFLVRNVATDGRYCIEKEILADPSADVILQRVRFLPIVGEAAQYRLYALLAPHLNNRGNGNTAWVGDYKGTPMLFAERNNCALALACSTHWLARSVGFVGFSDGWQELRAHGRLQQSYQRAENGNIALTGEIDLQASSEFVLALGFGGTPAAAGQRALASLFRGFGRAKSEYLDDWTRWHRSRTSSAAPDPAHPLVDFSAAVLRVHESKHFRGGVIASLSIPWGFSKGDDDLGGYHLVWPRDLVETAGGFLAADAHHDARRVLRFLQVTQDADGHWCQNMWLDGSPYWTGIQMDEVALPVLLVDLAMRCGALMAGEGEEYWPMARRALGYIVRNGPVSPQDRWEEDAGYSPFTLGAEIAALIVGADDAERNGHPGIAAYLRETADAWNASLDSWIYVTDTSLAATCGVAGYYVRVAEPDQADAASPKHGFVPIKNRPASESTASAALTVSPDALALVRFGLRAADDPRIENTVRVIDALLKVDTPRGPSWHRYNGDGYGEHDDGGPFDGTGTGRAWPLLTGERGHYELAAGRAARAEELAAAMEAFAGDGLLIPEQVWDAPDIVDRELFAGQASGSAQPLVWAHAEYLKLRRSIRECRVFDQPPQTLARYAAGGHGTTPYAIWRFNQKVRTMAAGKILRIETLARATVVWGVDGWQQVKESETVDTELGVFVADLETTTLSSGASVEFTFFWLDEARWEQTDFRVVVA
ncbi:MAG: glucan 1,4-alpha-glucosidase [Acidobacteriota bacterium]